MKNRVDAKKAFTGLAYSRLRSQPLYLEWAPVDVFAEGHEPVEEEVKEKEPEKIEPLEESANEAQLREEEKQYEKILVRNIPFQASLKEVRALFAAFGELKNVRLPKKVGGQSGHRGFGFVEFLAVSDAKAAYDALVHSTHLYGRRLVLEWSKC
jgi:multiple RNA-binding domain-containing protein 1